LRPEPVWQRAFWGSEVGAMDAPSVQLCQIREKSTRTWLRLALPVGDDGEDDDNVVVVVEFAEGAIEMIEGGTARAF